ncbi:lantibiotic dehydratase [Hymenobacter aquaticus]|nr:lantibiotic dehydratase [Hymenobacter aquaticus]
MKSADLQPLDFYLLRTPALPYNQATPWTEVIESPAFQRALFFSSPDLHEQLQELLAARLDAAARLKVEKSLYKYWLRMSFRSTPFGLFAGTNLGTWGQLNQADIVPAGAREHVRLDMQVVCQLVDRLEHHALLRQHLRFFANNTVYYNHSKVRYIEPRQGQGYIHHQLSGVARNEYVEQVLTQARAGATLAELSQALVGEDVSFEEALEFVEDIAEAGLLASELAPRISDPGFELSLLHWLQAKVAAVPAVADAWLHGLMQFLEELQQAYSAQPMSIERARALAAQLSRLEVEFSLKTLFQLDLFNATTTNTLTPQVFRELSNSLSLLWGTMPAQEDPQLLRFKETFLERYEEAEVPLLLALDSESGLGFPVNAHADASPLLSGLQLPAPPDAGSAGAGSKWDIFLQRKYLEALTRGEQEIRLTDQDLQPFAAGKRPPLPFSMNSNIQVFRSTAPGAAADADFWLYHTVSDGPSCSTLLGRFCCGDAQLRDRVESALAREQSFHDQQVIAEIIHLPQSRIGNIIMRPKLREFEIPVLSAGHPDSHQIALDDLLLSVRDNRLVLRSKSLNKEVIPSLSSAHDYSKGSIPLYYFLSSLQYQGLMPSYTWNWGLLRHATYQPRVVLNRTILARAGWALDYNTVFAQGPESVAALRAYLRTTTIPRFVTFQEMDNQLPIDLEHDLALSILLDQLRKEKSIWLREDLFKALASPVTDATGAYRYNNEYSIPWEYQAARRRAPLPAAQVAAVQRDFMPGDEWVYAKIYCGVKLGDELLVQVLRPFTEQLQQQGVISQWFFIRYNDPHHHLRVRFRKTVAQVDILARLNALLAPYIQDKSVWKVQQDTYKRELERYGAATIAAVEDLFYHDSVAVARVLTGLEGNEAQRWLAALVGVDYILDDFGLALPQKIMLLERMASLYALEFGMDTSDGRKNLGAKFRTHRAAIETALLEKEPFGAVYRQRSAAGQPSVQHILAALGPGLDLPLQDLLASYVHMFLNRFFRGQQRLHELLLYDLLDRAYTSFQARNRVPAAPAAQVV